MRIFYILENKGAYTGGHFISELMVQKLRELGNIVNCVVPKIRLTDPPLKFKGISHVLFFYSLLEYRKEIQKYDIIQGSTLTALPFLSFSTPVVSHFGSTNLGFLRDTPLTSKIPLDTRGIWHKLKKDKVIAYINTTTRKPMRDLAEVESFVASRAAAVVATSQIVKSDLVRMGAREENVHVIHNGIDDFWFEGKISNKIHPPKIVYLGRVNDEVFIWKLKGLDRIIHLYQSFPETEKVTFLTTENQQIGSWLNENVKNHTFYGNFTKEDVKKTIRPLRGSIFFLSSRYEGFSLSLIEAMSQGLIPVCYPVGVAPEIIENGVNGFLVKNQAETKKVVKLLLSDTALREKMSLNAFKTSKRFQSKILAKQLVILYKKILKEKGSLKKLQSEAAQNLRPIYGSANIQEPLPHQYPGYGLISNFYRISRFMKKGWSGAYLYIMRHVFFPKNTRAGRYFFPAILAVILLFAKIVFAAYLGASLPFLLFAVVVILSTWYGGLGPGILATMLTALIDSYFFLDPAFAIGGRDSAIRTIVKIAEGVIITLLVNEARKQFENLKNDFNRLMLQGDNSLGYPD